MYTFRLAIQLSLCVTIHNQCLNTKLISPVYFCNAVVCPELSDKQIDVCTTMNVSFKISATQDDFEGALLFKLQRSTDKGYSMDTSATETNDNGEKHVYMLVAWKMKDAKPFVHVALVEHTKEFTWNKNRLRKLYNKNLDRLKEYDDAISDTWIMDDNIAFKTTFNVRDLKGSFEHIYF
jgi:hypothetical protein